MRDTNVQTPSNDLEDSDAEGTSEPTNITIIIFMFTTVLNNFFCQQIQVQIWEVATYTLISRIKELIVTSFCNNKIELKYLMADSGHIKLAWSFTLLSAFMIWWLQQQQGPPDVVPVGRILQILTKQITP